MVNWTKLAVRRIIAGRDRAEQEVTVTPNIFRKRLHAHINAVREGVKHHTCRICIVERHRDTALVRRHDDGWHILDIHGDRARAFAPNERGVLAYEICNARTNQRVVCFDLYVQAAHQAFGHRLVRTISRDWHQSVAACLAIREVNQSNRRLPPRHDQTLARAFDPCDTRGKLKRGRRSIKPVRIPVFCLPPIIRNRRLLFKHNG